MKITIVGAGAIGGTTGAYLSAAGYDVTLVDSVVEHVRAINERGIRISGHRGDNTFRVKAITPDELAGPLEMVILAVKAQHTEQALKPVAPHLGPGSFVLSMQNGLVEETIAGIIGADKTVGCFIQFGADYMEPGHILLAYDFPIYVGEIDGSISERARAIASVLGGFMETVVTQNIWGHLWGKMCLGSVYFAGALTAEPFTSVLANKKYQPMLAAVGKETCTVARALGVTVMPVGDFDPNMFMVDSLGDLAPVFSAWEPKPPKPGEPKNLKPFTGIQRDIMVRRRRTEVDHQPGMVVRKGLEAGVDTPLNSQIVRMIKEVEDGKRPLSWDNLEELARYAPAWK